MSFPEFYCTAKATGNGYDFANKEVTFNKTMGIILIAGYAYATIVPKDKAGANAI